MARELLAYRLLSLHNITFYQRLVAAMRGAIAEARFDPFRTRFLDRYGVESHAGPDGVPSSDHISMDGEV